MGSLFSARYEGYFRCLGHLRARETFARVRAARDVGATTDIMLRRRSQTAAYSARYTTAAPVAYHTCHRPAWIRLELKVFGLNAAARAPRAAF